MRAVSNLNLLPFFWFSEHILRDGLNVEFLFITSAFRFLEVNWDIPAVSIMGYVDCLPRSAFVVRKLVPLAPHDILIQVDIVL